MKMRFWYLWILGLTLVLAACMQAIKPKSDESGGKGRHLAKVLPATLPGWSSQSLPLGNTEAIEGAVEKTLKFDDVYFREFNSPLGTLSLYVAYWGPGKMPTQLVASHTPDRCWTSAGWQCEAIRHHVEIGGLRPGEWRDFEVPGGAQRLKVIYWQLVGNDLYDFGDRFNRVPSPWRWWRDVAVQIFRAPPEQYFVRLASSRSFSELESDPGYRELVGALGKLGLAEQTSVKP